MFTPLRIGVALGLVALGAGVGAFALSSDTTEPEPPPVAAGPSEDLPSQPAQTMEPDQRIELVAPPVVNRWEDHPGFEDAKEGLRAMAYRFNAPIYSRANRSAGIKGLARRGTVLAVEERVFGSGCDNGGWYRLVSGGVVCSRDGFLVSNEPDLGWTRKRDLSNVLPYTYAAVTRGSTRYFDLPEAGDEGVKLDGDYFVTVVGREQHHSKTYIRTAIGHVVEEQDVEIATEPRMSGELLGERQLPLAFLYHEEPAPVLRQSDAGLEEIGSAQKYARFQVAEVKGVAGQELAFAAGGYAVARDQVRIAERIDRPESIPARSAWIHVNLAEQTLVAYDEDDQPLFATLVASGKDGYDTPTGTHRIREKYISITMSGEDPHDGPYEVEEVPWTMYYFEGFALHGAYWHDAFGAVRSHGCTNLAPHDARWLYDWTTPRVPDGWQGRRLRRGTWVHLTR